MKNNYYSYNTAYGRSCGLFHIYQDTGGAIYLLMGNSFTQLTSKQVEELQINLDELIDFHHEDYLKFYSITI